MVVLVVVNRIRQRQAEVMDLGSETFGRDVIDT